MNERGAVGVALLAVASLGLLLAVVVATLAGVQLARIRATTAADAAALAAAPVTFLPFGASGTPADEARRFARLNGGTLIMCRCEVDRSFQPRTAEVTVRTQVDLPVIGEVFVEATGRAEFTPAALLGG